jgi:hypothetical protein
MLAELPRVGRGHGRARRPVDTNERPPGPLHPPRGGPVAASAAPDRGATAVAVSAADQRGGLAGGRGGAGWAGAGGVRPGVARPGRGGHGRRRCGRAVAWWAARARAGGGLAGAGACRLLVDADGAVDRAAAGVGGLAALAAPDRVAGRLAAGGPCHRRRGGKDRAAGTAVRGGPADQLGWLGDAVAADHHHDRDPHGGAVHAGAGGPLAQPRQVGGGCAGGADRAWPHRPRSGHPDRCVRGGGDRGDAAVAGLPAAHSGQRLPDHLPARP